MSPSPEKEGEVRTYITPEIDAELARKIGAPPPEVEDRWPEVFMVRRPAYSHFPAQHTATRELAEAYVRAWGQDSVPPTADDIEIYHPESAPNVLTPDEAAQIAHHLPPDHELWKRLFNYAADEGGHS